MKTFTTVETHSQYNADVGEFLREAEGYDIVAFDTETDMQQDNHLVLLQFGLPNGKQYLFDHTFVSKLAGYIQHTTLIAHNAAFDGGVLSKYGIQPKRWIDTMLIEQVMLAGDPHYEGAGLAKVLKRYFDIDMDKAAQTTFSRRGFSGHQLEYAALDVAHMHRLYEAQCSRKLYNEAVVDLELRYLPVVIEMQQTGMRVNVANWQQVIGEIEDKYDQALVRLSAYAQINWKSPRQVLPILRKHGVNIDTTKEDALLKCDQVPIVSDLLQFKQLTSQLSKLGTKFLEHVTDGGTIHTNYRQIIATGRSSSGKVNLQNIPKPYRKYFTPSTPGNVFVRADYSQQELIILAYAAGEKSWLDAVKQGEDLHRVCAREIYPEFAAASEEEQAEMRKKAKAVNFSLAYGTGSHSLSDRIGLTYRETAELKTAYFNKFPAIERYLSGQSVRAKESGVTLTLPPYCRVRMLRDEQQSAMGRKGKNSPIQGSAADMTKLACAILYKKQLPIKFVHTIHDEIVVECAPDFADECLIHLLSAMREAGDEIVPAGYIRAEGEITNTWK